MTSPTLLPSTALSSTAEVSKESVISITNYVNDNTMNKEMVRELAGLTSDIISTIAGNGDAAYGGDNGAATSAAINYPNGIALDVSGIPRHSISLQLYSYSYIIPLGNVYIADWGNERIRKVTVSTGIITTIAGTGTASYSGDNGQATSATLNFPLGVTVDSSGNILIYTEFLVFLLVLFDR